MRISDWSADVCSSDLVFDWLYFTRTGKGLGSNEYLRGAQLGTVRQVRRALRRETKGSLSIGGINVPHAFETEHVLICGAPDRKSVVYGKRVPDRVDLGSIRIIIKKKKMHKISK